MRITVNGQPRDVADDMTIGTLLDDLGLAANATVVQRNDEIVDRTRYGDTVLAEADVLELVRFVGGG